MYIFLGVFHIQGVTENMKLGDFFIAYASSTVNVRILKASRRTFSYFVLIVEYLLKCLCSSSSQLYVCGDSLHAVQIHEFNFQPFYLWN